jgi:hypothetical protein
MRTPSKQTKQKKKKGKTKEKKQTLFCTTGVSSGYSEAVPWNILIFHGRESWRVLH